MSLSSCLKKAGKSILKADSDLIKDIAAENNDLPAREAALIAIDEVLEMAVADKRDILEQIVGDDVKLAAAMIAQEKDGAPDAMEAWHGSRHKFAALKDSPLGRFMLSKMSTGEGGQYFAWGIYVAEKVTTAYHYMRAGYTPPTVWQGVKIFGIELTTGAAPSDRVIASGVSEGYSRGGATAAADILNFHATTSSSLTITPKVEAITELELALAALKESDVPLSQSFDEDWYTRELHEEAYVKEALKILKSDHVAIPEPTAPGEPPPGYVYKVEIDDAALPHILDWDAPVTSQPAFVKKQLGDEIAALLAMEEDKKLSLEARSIHPKFHALKLPFKDEAYSVDDEMGLPEADIVQVSDEGGSNEGSWMFAPVGGDLNFNFYDSPEAAFKAYKASRVSGERLYYYFVENYEGTTQEKKKQASLYLADLGISGVRFFDNASRVGKRGTRNYIAFDPDMLKITQRSVYDKMDSRSKVAQTTIEQALKNAREYNTPAASIAAAIEEDILEDLGDKFDADTVTAIEEARSNAAGLIADHIDETTANPNVGANTTAHAVADIYVRNLHPKDPYRMLLSRYINSKINLKNVDLLTRDDTTIRAQLKGQEEGLEYKKKAGLYYHSHHGYKRRTAIINSDWVGTHNERQEFIDPDGVIKPYVADFLTVFVHEVTHAVSHEGLRVDGRYAEEVERLRKLAIDYLATSDSDKAILEARGAHYGLKNADEFVSEALSNEEFQRFLASVIDPNAPTQSLWRTFIRALGNMLGITVDANSVLARVVSLTPELMNEFTEGQINRRRWTGIERIQTRSNKEYSALIQNVYGKDFEGASVDAADAMNVGFEPALTRVRAVMSRIIGGGGSGDGSNFWKNLPRDAKNVPAATGTGILGFMPMDVIVTEYSKDFDGLGRDGGNPLKDYNRFTQLAQTYAKKFERKADPLFTALKRMEKKYTEHVETFNDIVQQSTMFQIDPTVPWAHDKNRLTRNNKRRSGAGKKAHTAMARKYKAMPAPMQAMYRRLRDFYGNTLTEMKSAVIDNMLELYDITNVRGLHAKIMTATAADIAKMPVPVYQKPDGTYERVKGWDVMAKTFTQFAKLTETNGPYFPLMRFGDFSLEFDQTTTHGGFSSKRAAEADAADVKADSEGSRTGNYQQMPDGTWSYDHKEFGYLMEESRSKALDKKAELEAAGFNVDGPSITTERNFGDDTAIGSVMALAESKLKGNEKAKLALYQAMISHMPATNMQRRMLRRANIAGASKDSKRVFANYAKSAGHYMATLKYRKQIDQSVEDLRVASKNAARLKSPRSVEVGRVAAEVAKRTQINTEAGKASQLAAQFGFINYLLSLSYSVVNSTQVMTMTMPYLSGKYNRRKAAAAIGNAYRMVYKDIGSTVMSSWGGAKAFVDPGAGDLNELTNNIITTLDNNGNGGASSMIRSLADRGILEATFSLEMSEGAKMAKNRGPIKGFFNTMIEAGRFLPYTVEVMNRSTTAIAAYHLAIEKGMSQDAATESAREAVVKTQFDYTVLNRPRYFVQADVLRAMSMFKVHPLGVYSYIIHNARRTMGPNATAEEKAEARRGLSTFVMMHGAFAGIAGSLMAEPIRAALGLINQVFDGDDDDSWLDDPELAVRNMMFELFGSQVAAEMLTHGLPRGVGIDMSTRIGLQNLLVMWQEGDNAWESAKGSVVKSLLGPIFGYNDSISRAVAQWQAGGDMTRALEYMAPKQVRDYWRAGRYKSEGMTDFAGKEIVGPEKFSRWDYAVRVFGFTPAVEANIYEKRTSQKSLTRRLGNKKRSLLNEYARADAPDKPAVRKKINDFNANLPADMRREYRITGKTLVTSRKRRRESERMTIEGITYTKGTRSSRQRYEAFPD